MEYTSSIETIDEVTRKIFVTIPVSLIKDKVSTELVKVTRNAQIKGFRPGKAPKEMVQKLYGESVRLDTANKLINSSLTDVMKGEKLEVVGTPEVEITTFEQDKDIAYTATVSLFPSPAVKGYEKLAVEVVKRELKEEDIEKAIEELRASRATMRKIEGRTLAQMKDVVDIAVAISSEDKKADRPEPLVISLGEKKLPEEVEAGIVGMKIGEAKQIVLPAPKNLTYEVTLNALFEKILPELNDEFASSLNMEVKTAEELRQKIREEFERQHKESEKGDIQVAIIDSLVAANEFKVPQVLLDDEIRALIVRAGLMDEQRASTTDIEAFRAGLGDVALKRVKGSIIIDRIGEAEKIKAEKEEIDEEIKSLALRSGVDVEYARKYLLEQGRIVGVAMEVTRQKVLDFLVGKAGVTFVDAPKESKESK